MVQADILQQALNKRLFSIGDADDTRLQKIRDAAASLSTSALKTPTLALDWTVVALHPDVPAPDPVFGQAGEALQQHWQTYQACFSDVPRELLRALLLQALAHAAAQNVDIATAVSLIARNVLPLYSAGNDYDLLESVYRGAVTQCNKRNREEWQPENAKFTLKATLPQLSFPNTTRPQVNQDALAQALTTAISGNPHWPQNNPSLWAQEFGKRAAPPIASAIQEAVAAAVPPKESIDKTLITPLAQYLSAITSGLQNVIHTFAGSTAAINRRTHLLWWKESGYSEISHVAYSALSPDIAALLMALDFAKQLPLSLPENVEFFLRNCVDEALTKLQPKKRSSVTLGNLVGSLISAPFPSGMDAALDSLSFDVAGKKTLTAFIHRRRKDGAKSSSDLFAATGLQPDRKMDYSDFTVWITREIQAQKALLASPVDKKS